MIEAHDIAMDGQVSLDEFKRIFNQNANDERKIDLVKQDSILNPLV